MSFVTRPVIAAVLLGVVLAGCGSEHDASTPASARLVGATGSSPGQIIVSQLGKERIGLQTAPVQSVSAAPGPRSADKVIVPYSALVYDPSGKTFVFLQRSPLTYIEVPATVDRISGGSAYLTVGPKPGTKVVTVGAEELYGVQTGVLDQT